MNEPVVTTRPMFSIVTITYQNHAGLVETVASVRAQTTDDYEHIVIDGGSRDGSAEWLAAHFTGTWISERDGGRYDAMNKGARLARGEYLWFLHAGDTLCKADVLETVRGYLAQSPMWAYGMARVIDPDKQLVGTLGFVPFKMFNFAILGHSLPHQATVFRRDLFEELGGYDLRHPISADQLFMLKTANHELPVSIPEFLCDFDSTGISAGRPWLRDYLDGEHYRRQFPPTLRWRTADTVVSFAYAAIRQLVRRVRRTSRQASVAVGAHG